VLERALLWTSTWSEGDWQQRCPVWNCVNPFQTVRKKCVCYIYIYNYVYIYNVCVCEFNAGGARGVSETCTKEGLHSMWCEKGTPFSRTCWLSYDHLFFLEAVSGTNRLMKLLFLHTIADLTHVDLTSNLTSLDLTSELTTRPVCVCVWRTLNQRECFVKRFCWDHMFKVASTKKFTALWGVQHMSLDPEVHDTVWHAMPKFGYSSSLHCEARNA